MEESNTNDNGWTTTGGIIRADKRTLATLDGDTLAKRIDRYVKSAFRRAKDAKLEYDRASEAVRNCDPANVEEMARRQEAVRQAHLVVRREIEDIEHYLDEQKELFRSKGLEADRAYREAIVPTGEILPNGKEVFRIVKRGESLEESDDIADDTLPSVHASRNYSDRIGLSADQRRGRYNDAGMLIEQTAASVDPEEVVPMGQVCM